MPTQRVIASFFLDRCSLRLHSQTPATSTTWSRSTHVVEIGPLDDPLAYTPPPGDYGEGDSQGPAMQDLLFYSRQHDARKVHVDLRTWRSRQQRAFEEWMDGLDDFLPAYLSAVSGTLPDRSTWANLSCNCSRASTTQILFIDLHASQTHAVSACAGHLPLILVQAGTFPSTAQAPRVAFGFPLIRLFLCLQDNARIGAFNFSRATLQAHAHGTSIVPASPLCTTRDTARRPLRSASEWFQAIEQRCTSYVLNQSPLYAQSRPDIKHDDLKLSVRDLADRCPACFGHLLGVDPPYVPHLDRDNPSVIVCIDGNFQHKRVRADDAVARTPRSPTFFLSLTQAESARSRFENPAIGTGPHTGCSSEVRAAIDGAVKTSTVQYDIGGVVGMTCRHGSPLILVDVRESGEAHYYAYALLEALLDICGPTLDSLGVCYDIGCKFAVSPRLEAALRERNTSVSITHAVSLFHVYGHDNDCQLKYSPRRIAGFGLTDGEAVERLWSSLSDIVSLTRDMSEADRLSTLSSRLEALARSHRQDLMTFFHRHLIKTATTRETKTQSFMDLLPHLVQYTSETLAQAYATPSPQTGLPSRITEMLTTFNRRRRDIAFKKNEAVRQLAVRKQNNARNRIVDLSVQANLLYFPLRSWHFLSATLRRRHAQHSHDGTTRLSISKSDSAAKAKEALRSLNEAILKYHRVLPPSLQSRLHVIDEATLYDAPTLYYVRGLLSPADIEEEPWVLDLNLAAAMDIVDTLARVEEAQARIAREVAHMDAWAKSTGTRLKDLHAEYTADCTEAEDSDKVAFVQQHISLLDGVVWVWRARLDKISIWQQGQISALRNQRASHNRTEHLARFNVLLKRYAALDRAWATVLPGSQTFEPGSSNASSDATSANAARDLADDEEDDDLDVAVGIPQHPLDDISSALLSGPSPHDEDEEADPQLEKSTQHNSHVNSSSITGAAAVDQKKSTQPAAADAGAKSGATHPLDVLKRKYVGDVDLAEEDHPLLKRASGASCCGENIHSETDLLLIDTIIREPDQRIFSDSSALIFWLKKRGPNSHPGLSFSN
ncbi:hypothetical protein V8E36_009040 [Tilletia maclaganii]